MEVYITDMKNRTIIGIVCIVLALAVTFGIAPLVNKFTEAKTNVIILKQDVSQGHMITENDIETKKMYKSDIPADAYKTIKDVVGKFAAGDLKKGYWLSPTAVTLNADSADDIFKSLDGTKQAISITISSFAGGLSGKLKNGDIISLVIYDKDEAVIPGALTYVRVITTTTAEGFDKDELQPNDDGTYELPTTLTLLVNPTQAKLLVEYENSGTIHADLVYRGKSATAQIFLDVQDKYFEILKNMDPDATNDELPSITDIIKDANDIIWGKDSEVHTDG